MDTKRDLTDPAQGDHGMQRIVERVTDALAVAAPDADVRVRRAPPLTAITDNYDALGYSADAVARDKRYSHYVDDRTMLRSHTSAMIPPLLRELASTPSSSDVVLVCPGIVYRRDAIDRMHTGEPHQLDIWRIRTDRASGLAAEDLRRLVRVVVGAALSEDVELRLNPAVHPYTLDGLEIEVLHRGSWVEIGECGLAHPDVLGRAGLVGATGLAMGMGLDRLLMLEKAVPDIRLLRSEDPRVASQMLDLSPYRSVATTPPITRDLSVVVPATDAAEDIGDRVRTALGDDALLVEEVSIAAQTPYEELPAAARARLAIEPDQKNVLVRVVLRAEGRTLTHEEANRLRNRVYAAIHRGAVAEWA